MKCSKCGQEGHNAKTCGRVNGESSSENRGGAQPRKTPRRAPAAVSSSDVTTVKDAVVGVIEALSTVDAVDRERVIKSALMILGE